MIYTLSGPVEPAKDDDVPNLTPWLLNETSMSKAQNKINDETKLIVVPMILSLFAKVVTPGAICCASASRKAALFIKTPAMRPIIAAKINRLSSSV